MTAPVDDDRGQAYLRDTRHTRSRLVGGRMDWAHQPDWFKTYPDAPRVRLPGLALDDSGLFDALARRRSVRAYGPGPLALGELGALHWAGAGITARRDGFAFRTAFFDDEAAAILGVDPDVEPVIHMSTAGRPGDTRSTQPPLALG